MTARQPIYFIGGSKGGVGKSIFSMALIDYLRTKHQETLLIESDTSNPDVWKMYRHLVDSESVDLDKAEGWIDLLNILEEKSTASAVINSAARNGKGIKQFGEMLEDSLDELKRDFVTFWIINRQRDPIELLHKYRASMPGGTLHVVRNGHYGEEEKFELYNTSQVKTEIENAGGQSLTFPELADRLSDKLYSQRVPIEEGCETLQIGDRAELQRWRKHVGKMFAKVIPHG